MPAAELRRAERGFAENPPGFLAKGARGITLRSQLGLIALCIGAGCSANEDVWFREAGFVQAGGGPVATGSGGSTIGGGGSLGPSTSTGTPCGASATCGPGMVCAQGHCAPADHVCRTNGECSGDTYCCTVGCLPQPETVGRCVPFGTSGGFNDQCRHGVTIGLFEASVQCEWRQPPPGDAYPDHVNVLPTPLVANLASDSGAAAEIIAVAYNGTDGDGRSGFGSDPAFFGVIRVLNGQTCALEETIDAGPADRIIAASTPAIGDLDGDGTPELVALRALTGVFAFRWDPITKRHVKYWATEESNISGVDRYDGVNLHDLDDDGLPEVIAGSEVYDGRTGHRLNAGQVILRGGAGTTTVLGDVDGDGQVELVAGAVYRWNTSLKRWDQVYPGAPLLKHYAFADFGTPMAGGGFDPKRLDGFAEIVAVQNSRVVVATLQGQTIVDANIKTIGGGPPTIGDFDGDRFPEIATAGGGAYVIVDLDCAPGAGGAIPAGCADAWLRWSAPSQDLSSNNTGSSIFDFEGDGKAEAVYADECFLRIYSGSSGDVLYSAARTSCTWYENPVIADPDRDSNTEIVIGSNRNCWVSCPAVDPIHRGVRCDESMGGADCGSHVCDRGYCRCQSNAECADGYRCETPPVGTPGYGNTCRAYHAPMQDQSGGQVGVRVLRDRLDRWASSRAMWNQHAYSITNINDDGTVPKSSAWMPNFRQSGLDNYRQNSQGITGAAELPDITGRLSAKDLCQVRSGTVTLTATVCNRGHRAVGAALPATFYVGDPATGKILCTSYTAGPVPIGGCLGVSCEISEPIKGTVTMATNDDGRGGRTTVECETQNNRDSVEVTECTIVR